MPPDRRRRRFRRPGAGRWLTETPSTLRIELAPQVRNTLTAWMRLYGEANDVPGLATGPIETRFARLRENTAADSLVVWTTPGRWAGGEGLSLRFPDLHLEFTCTLADGHLIATKVGQVPEDARSPDREPGAVGVVVHPDRIPLPPEDVDSSEPDEGVEMLERHFAQLAGRRWGGFVEPLMAALDAEARDDEARTQRLTVAFTEAALTRGGEEDVWRLKGLNADALRGLDDGEWLEILDDQGRSRASARVIDAHPGSGTLVIGVRTSADPPRTGFVRPRSRKKILEQKRALLEELASPTGSLPNLVRLVAAPASMPTPRQVRPAQFVNTAVLRNRSQARAVALALGLEDGQALLIQGPPGTGKSTTAAEIDVQLILRDPGVKILVCSHSNHGTDNMLMKVLPFIEDAPERIARVGFYERIAKEARPFYAAADTDLGEKNIIFTTIDALVLQDIAGARVYDYVILDEANRAGVLDSLLALARGKRMVLVGDPMQLQPVMSEAEQQIVAASAPNNGAGRHGRGRGSRRPALTGVAQPGANHVIGKSLFAWIQERRFASGSTVLLDQQNRMHPAIGELVSRVFYGNRVRTGPAAPRRGTGLAAFPSPVSWVDTRSLRGNVESRAGGTSLFNVAEARLVTSITRHLATLAPPNLTIGVITAYAEQRDLLRRLMGPHDWPPDRQMEIDTVDAFEGREKDIIVLSLVRANRRRDIGFLRLEQRLNVAVSRSRRLIILVGDTSTLRGGYFHNLVNQTQTLGQLIPAPKLIGQFLSRNATAGAPAALGTGAHAGARRPWQDRGQRRRERDGREGQIVRVDGEGDEQNREALAGQVGAGALAGFEAEAGAGAPGQAGHAGRPVQDRQEGQEGQEGGFGSRRRRRRAWERRRDRLRALREGGPDEMSSAEGNGDLTVQPADAEGGARDVSVGVDGVRPAMAPGATERVPGRAGEDAGGAAERDAHSGRQYGQEQGQRQGQGQRSRRRRRFGMPRNEDVSDRTGPAAGGFGPSDGGAVGTAGMGPRGADEQIFMPVGSGEDELSTAFAPAADLTSPSAAAGRRRRRPSRIADTIAALEAQVSVSTPAPSSSFSSSPGRGSPSSVLTSGPGAASETPAARLGAAAETAGGQAAATDASGPGLSAGEGAPARGRGRGARPRLTDPTPVTDPGLGSPAARVASVAELGVGSPAEKGLGTPAEVSLASGGERTVASAAEVSVRSAGTGEAAPAARRGRPRRGTPSGGEAPSSADAMSAAAQSAAPASPGSTRTAETPAAARRGRTPRAVAAGVLLAAPESEQPAVSAPARRGRRPAAATTDQSATAPVAAPAPAASTPASAAPARARRLQSAATGEPALGAVSRGEVSTGAGANDAREPSLLRTPRPRRAAAAFAETPAAAERPAADASGERRSAASTRVAAGASTQLPLSAAPAQSPSASDASAVEAPKSRGRRRTPSANDASAPARTTLSAASAPTEQVPVRGRGTRRVTETDAGGTPDVTPAKASRRPSRAAGSAESQPSAEKASRGASRSPSRQASRAAVGLDSASAEQETSRGASRQAPRATASTDVASRPQETSREASRSPSRRASRAAGSAESEPAAEKASRGASRAGETEPNARTTPRGKAAAAQQAVTRAGTNGISSGDDPRPSASGSAARRRRAAASDTAATTATTAAAAADAAEPTRARRQTARATTSTGSNGPAEAKPTARPARARKA